MNRLRHSSGLPKLTFFYGLMLFAQGAFTQDIQWASTLHSFSTEYSRKASSARMVLGPPEVMPGFGPSDVAWATSRPTSGIEEFVRVGFERPMAIRQVFIAESLNPGAIYRILAYDPEGRKQVLYQAPPGDPVPFYRGSRMFSVTLDEPTPYLVSEIKLILRTSRVEGMSQIDAIGISASTAPWTPDFPRIEDDLFDEPAENLGPLVNSTVPDLLPMISPDGRTLYFARKNHLQNRGAALRDDIWISRIGPDGEWTEAEHGGDVLNNVHHNFVGWIRPDGNALLLPHDYQHPEEGSAFRVSFTVRVNTTWTEPRVLPIPDLYNDNPFTCIHMNNKGDVLLLSIERDDTEGGLDLYVSQRDLRGNWTTPKSLGPTLNTPAMEGSVFLAADNRTLYFSSNGLPGYGGYDMYISKRLDDSWTNWSAPLNLGPRINGERDDYYYTIPASGEYAYFAADPGRFGGADLYRIRLPRSARPEPVTLIDARVVDGQSGDPIPSRLRFREEELQTDVLVERAVIIDPRSDLPGTLVAEAEGYFPSILTPDQGEPAIDLWMDGEPAPLESARLEADLPEGYREVHADLRLVPLQVGNLVRLNGVYFTANESFLLNRSETELDRVAEFLREHAGLRVEIGGHTNGLPPEAFCLELSTARARTVRDYLISKGVSADQLEWKGFGKSQPVAGNETLEGRKQNQRVELRILATGL